MSIRTWAGTQRRRWKYGASRSTSIASSLARSPAPHVFTRGDGTSDPPGRLLSLRIRILCRSCRRSGRRGLRGKRLRSWLRRCRSWRGLRRCRFRFWLRLRCCLLGRRHRCFLSAAAHLGFLFRRGILTLRNSFDEDRSAGQGWQKQQAILPCRTKYVSKWSGDPDAETKEARQKPVNNGTR